MKPSCILALVHIIAFSAFGQEGISSFEASMSGEDRMTLVKNSIQLTPWHEKPFWELYKTYMAKKKEAMLTYNAVNAMAKTDGAMSDTAAYQNGMRLLAFRGEELELWKQYFGEVGLAHNGVIALQFLQTETLMDIMESSYIYEGSPKQRFYFHVKTPASAQADPGKYAAITRALSLDPAETKAFFPIYSKYERECEDLLGENYDLFEMFVDNPVEYTPAMAKTLGSNMLIVMERELKLKERYFVEMNSSIGSSLAARFLAWEDYYSTISKMNVWNDAIVADSH